MARREVAGRDGPGCAHCGIEGVALQLDHVVPVSEGGPEWEISNLQLLCGICHKAKSARETRARARRIPRRRPSIREHVGELRTSRRW
jgi:5-methylcytosine-specific restriction endonuclease McrA